MNIFEQEALDNLKRALALPEDYPARACIIELWYRELHEVRQNIRADRLERENPDYATEVLYARRDDCHPLKA